MNSPKNVHYNYIKMTIGHGDGFYFFFDSREPAQGHEAHESALLAQVAHNEHVAARDTKWHRARLSIWRACKGAQGVPTIGEDDPNIPVSDAITVGIA